MEIVIAVAERIVEYTVEPVGRWLCYSCHYKSNMENLKNQVKTLRNAKDRVQHAIEAASNNGDEIEDDVKTWLTEVDGFMHQLATKKFGGDEEEEESRNSNASCLNLKQRHQISREAKKMAGNISELLENGNFDRVSYRPASQEMVTPRNMDYMTFDSRISITNKIMEALRDANIHKIGVWGSPGVGKSTLMKEIFGKAKEEGLFNEVALANVTDSADPIRRIQGEIAEMLGLELGPDRTEIGRAARLRARLEKDKEKKTLVILDDIWKHLDLEEIGITPSKRCKVLLTSRDRQVLSSEMGTEENNFKLDILEEEAAWNLFEKMAGDSLKDDLVVQSVAIKVAKACGGLPIALVTVSRALKNQKNLGDWEDALVELTRPPPEHDTRIWSPVYSCIQLSYKHLVGRELKSLFLLCAQQGYYISYRDLLKYGFGLCLFHGIHTLKEARNRLDKLVRNLQDACLLLQSPHSSEEYYMHDIVRHVATIIASNDHNMFVMRSDGGQKAWPDVDALKRCEALSVLGGQYPEKMEFPKLRYFHVQEKYLPTSIFFQGIDTLEVLSLTNMVVTSPPFPFPNLRALCLDGCKLGNIGRIGKVSTLVILSLAYSNILGLSKEIGSLTHLRLLDLTNCVKLHLIPSNVLSRLVNLEELYMRNICFLWEVEEPNNEGKLASLAELKHLSHLVTLEIDIRNGMKLPKDLFSQDLERYKICIEDIWTSAFEGEAFSRTLHFKLNMSFQLDFGIKMLLKKTEYLYLDESNRTTSILYELDREDFQQLKHLHIQNNNIKHIPNLRTPAVTFPILETFVLKGMTSLKEICQGNLPLTSFKNLKVLKVESCQKLRFIFSSSIARGLSLLEELNITRCNIVGVIFMKEEENGIEEAVGDMMLFHRLQTLVLEGLPKLVSFLSTRETNSEGSHDLQLPLLHHHQLSFPSLKELHLRDLPRIKHVWSKEVFRFQDFRVLLHFHVKGCGSLESLFPAASVSTSLPQLKSLEIEECGVMEEIVEREDGTDPTARLLFPSLNFLRLDGLPKLKSFYQGLRTLESSSSTVLHEQGGTLFGVEELSFPSLEALHLRDLPRIKHVWSKEIFGFQDFRVLLHFHVKGCESLESLFPAASVATSLTQLKSLEVEDCGVMEEIVTREDGTDPTTRLLFPSLNVLRLDGLLKLKWFYQGVLTLESSSSKELHEQGGTLFGLEEVDFPNLTKLNLRGLPKLRNILNIKDSHQRHKYSFQKLLDIDVSLCKSLESLFPAALAAASLPQLKSLKIVDCGVMEEIVAGEDRTDPTTRLLFPSLNVLRLDGLLNLKWFYQRGRTLESSSSKELHEQGGTLFEEVAFPNLTNLDLCGLPKIKHVWSKDPQTILGFQDLKEINVRECASLKSLFPASVGGLLKQLEMIRINNCGVEEIVGAEGEEAVGRTLVFEFPRVTCLHLTNLPTLECFYNGVYTSKWPMLRNMLIDRCEKVEDYDSNVVSTVKKGQSQKSIEQHLFDKVSDYKLFSSPEIFSRTQLLTSFP
ncbi:hypothetical protein CIPAW_15G126100 [Carya illinoinensis]|uniref:AAA+ ATPase domain-containing protein n=1 Tax=Carya illinoinensis TaxID=32201 RepID=A0A8T1N6V0_CARIL|nr:hypothetical protein CIPAW_15G126100 [Carya illinoinensis]